MREYSDNIRNLFPGKVVTVTFQITNDCTCACTYCYQINKGKKYMTKDTADKIIALLFDMYEQDNKDNLINKDVTTLVVDFIGGEPFLNIEIIEYVCNQILKKCIEVDHPWLNTLRFSICSNGDLYFSPKVQNFLKIYKDFISFTVTIDGPEEVHNTCRIRSDGTGNFEKAFQAWRHYNDIYDNDDFGTKITIAPENLPIISNIAQFFIDNKVKILAMNPAYESQWTIDQAKIYYNQLKIIADNLLEYFIDNNFFVEEHFYPIIDLQPWCGGYGQMLAFDPDGIAYPCVRFMDSSLGTEIKPIIIGNCNNGIYNTPEERELWDKFHSINRLTENTEECINCPIAHGCGECAAWSYQSAGGVLGIRNTNICHMHKARYLANIYYWNKYYRQNNIPKRMKFMLSKEDILNYIDEDEYNLLLELQGD